MARVRKLFPSYGSALAKNMISRLARERIVDRWVAAYVAQFDRKGILGGPSRQRELSDTIGREIVLAMTMEIRDLLPKFFGKKSLKNLKLEQMESIDAFLKEMVDALGRVWGWNTEEEQQFRRDLALYADFSKRRELRQTRRTGKRPAEESPFVARVALILDASLLEQARRAVSKFYSDVVKQAQVVLRETLQPSDS
jgi:hypothetical protein